MKAAVWSSLVAAAVCLAASGAVAEEFDAKFVSMEVPDKLVAGEVFLAKLTFQNSGTRGWTDQIKLRSLEPLDNMRWGTSYIIIGQGKKVAAGAQFTFSSHLRAPAEAGEHVFQWQVAPLTRGEPFGQPSEARKITVTARPPEPAPRPTPEAAGAKHVLTFGDFEYAGSFRLPKTVAGKDSQYAPSGVALRRMADGSRRVILNYGVLFEVEVPGLLKLPVEDGQLNLAEVKTVWGPIRVEKEGQPAISPNADFWWDAEAGILYWSSYHGYWTGAPWPLLAASKLGDDGTVTPVGSWHVPKSVGQYKSYWGGVTLLPKSFADKVAGGRRMALGFGGYYSICQRTSQGPALAAIATPDPAKAELDVLELLTCPWGNGHPAVRDGDYFLVAKSWGGDEPTSPAQGTWTMNDSVATGVVIDAPAGHGCIAFVQLATGRIGYDYGHITGAGHENWWYVYDPADLAKVAAGDLKPWQVQPRSRTKVVYPAAVSRGGNGLRDKIYGSCYDERDRQLYLYQRNVVGGRLPAVHVYRLK